MLMQFSHRNSSGSGRSVTVEAPVSITWNLPATGQAGTATITLPSDSTALDSNYINENGGSWVRMYGDADLGEWLGVIDNISEQANQTIITASEWWVLLQRIPVPFNRIFTHVTPAVIVQTAMSATPWGVTAVSESIPDIPSYAFTGEPVWDHIRRMMDLSGQELYITSDQTFRWGTQTSEHASAILVAPFDLKNASEDISGSGMVTQVSVLSGNNWYTARGNDLPTPAHAVVKEQHSPAGMVARAENELIRRSKPTRSITGQIVKDHWSIGLGDSFSAFLPYAGLGEGRLRQGRVVSRQYDSTTGALTTRLQILSPRQTVGVPSGLGGSGLVMGLKESERWQRRGTRYLSGE